MLIISHISVCSLALLPISVEKTIINVYLNAQILLTYLAILMVEYV